MPLWQISGSRWIVRSLSISSIDDQMIIESTIDLLLIIIGSGFIHFCLCVEEINLRGILLRYLERVVLIRGEALDLRRWFRCVADVGLVSSEVSDCFLNQCYVAMVIAFWCCSCEIFFSDKYC